MAMESVESTQYEYDGIFAPQEVARYLAATMPTRGRPLTSGRVLRWIRGGLLAPDNRGIEGHRLTIDFDDLVTCQVIALLREAGFSLQRVRREEVHWARYFNATKPFACASFWYELPHLFARVGGELLLSSGQIAMQFLAASVRPVRDGLTFSETTSRPTAWRPTAGVTLDPTVQFGQPCVEGTRIPTGALWGYVRGGDAVPFIAATYGLEVGEVERAVQWEQIVRTGGTVETPTQVPS